MFYRFWHFVITGIARVLFGTRVRGRDRLPKTGVFVVAPSHRSTLDIPFAASITWRRLRFMAKSEIFHGPFWTWVFDELGAVPVDRDGSDRAALQAMEAALKDGEPIAVYPEGTRRQGPTIGPIFSGASYLAYRTNVPLVPVGVGGSEFPFRRWFGIPWFSRVSVVVGEPFLPVRAEGLRLRDAVAATDAELLARIQACFDEACAWSDQRSRRSRLSAKQAAKRDARAAARAAAASAVEAGEPGEGG